jgi:Zn-dependent protease
MKGVLKLGQIAGIKIEVHWTFTLILVWIVFLDIQAGGNAKSSLLNVAFILVLFFCVVLHELGHALTAKKFNIQTQKITLLPIGGVALLDKMPENPKQELLVALAGPAVNIVIALFLSVVIPLKSYFELQPDEIERFLSTVSFQNFLFYVFIANIMLVVFNLIPAFPMDGGRVLRALLAFKLPRVRATSIAAKVGQVFAVIFFMLGLLYNPFLVLIALFIFIGAYAENRMVQQISILKGHKVEEAMLTNITLIKPENSIQEVVDILLAGSEKDFVVVADEKIVGILNHKDIIKHAGDRSLLVKNIMQRSFKTIEATLEITELFNIINRGRKNFFPVTSNQKLVGAIDRSNIGEFVLIQTNLVSKRS